MKLTCLLIFFLTALGFGVAAKANAPQESLEVDLSQKVLRFVDFSFAGDKISGEFSFDLKLVEGVFVCRLRGEDVLCAGRRWPWLELIAAKEGSVITLRSFNSPEFKAQGELDLSDRRIALDISFDFRERSDFLEGQITGSAQAWGQLGNFLVTGELVIEDGRYQDQEFSKFAISFLGKPPLLNLTDSRIFLKDGSIYTIEGTMDLRNFADLFPEAEFVSQRVTLGGWQVRAENEESAGFKKVVDNKFDVSFDTSRSDGYAPQAETQLRYKMRNNKFLNFKLQEGQTIIGFEKKKEF